MERYGVSLKLRINTTHIYLIYFSMKMLIINRYHHLLIKVKEYFDYSMRKNETDNSDLMNVYKEIKS